MSPDKNAPQPHPDPTLAAFGERLRRRREELQISQEQAAARVGVHWTGLSRTERGLQEPKLTMLLKIAQGLETTPGALVDGLPLDDSHAEKKPRRRRRPAE